MVSAGTPVYKEHNRLQGHLHRLEPQLHCIQMYDGLQKGCLRSHGWNCYALFRTPLAKPVGAAIHLFSGSSLARPDLAHEIQDQVAAVWVCRFVALVAAAGVGCM